MPRRGAPPRVPDGVPTCGAPSRPYAGRDMLCAEGHVFTGTPEEHEQAWGALAAKDNAKR